MAERNTHSHTVKGVCASKLDAQIASGLSAFVFKSFRCFEMLIEYENPRKVSFKLLYLTAFYVVVCLISYPKYLRSRLQIYGFINKLRSLPKSSSISTLIPSTSNEIISKVNLIYAPPFRNICTLIAQLVT